MTTKKLPETMCAMGFRRGDEEMPETTEDDLVIVVRDVYKTQGQPTANGERAKSDPKYKDTRKVAVSPGYINWQSAGTHKGQHSSGRKVGIQLLVMLSSPITDAKPKSASKAATAMSELF